MTTSAVRPATVLSSANADAPAERQHTGRPDAGRRSIPGVARVIAVASGKGGVGKSTTAVNLALALRDGGASVGMLDADLYGPSQPRMLGLQGQPEVTGDGGMRPLIGHGIQAMSIGFLVDDNSPVIWRGPMITQALTRLAFETQWQALDYLIIDLPPGTGDIHLTLAQRLPVSAAVIVTTPQDIALLDARKGLEMFRKAAIPVLGIIENMSTHVCTACGHEEPLFGHGGATRMAQEAGTTVIGSLPLDIRIRTGADTGVPIMVSDPTGPVGRAYQHIAQAVVAGLGSQEVPHGSAVPVVTID